MRMPLMLLVLLSILLLVSVTVLAQPGEAKSPPVAAEPVRMAKPGMKNKALEADMIAAIQQQGWKETPLRAVITSDEWRILRNQVTGIPLRRVLNGEVAVKTPAGKCRVFAIGIAQEHDGSKYGKSRYYSVGDSYDIECDDVKK